MITFPWYGKAEAALEPSWPLMTVLALLIVGITLGLLLARKPVLMAAWLVYLYMP